MRNVKELGDYYQISWFFCRPAGSASTILRSNRPCGTLVINLLPRWTGLGVQISLIPLHQPKLCSLGLGQLSNDAALIGIVDQPLGGLPSGLRRSLVG